MEIFFTYFLHNTRVPYKINMAEPISFNRAPVLERVITSAVVSIVHGVRLTCGLALCRSLGDTV